MDILIVKFKALVKIITLYKNWPEVIWTRLVLNKTGEIIYHLRVGIKIIVRKNDIVEGRVVDNTFLGEYFHPDFEIKPQDTVIDIGAHIGSFTLLAAQKAFQGKIFAFEPESDNFSQLRKNVRLNNFTNVEIYKAAVFKKTGFVNLNLLQPSSAHFNVFDKSDRFEKVKSMTLPEIFVKLKIEKCHFLKIDAEGGEFEILTTTPASILKLIDKIVFEFHPRPQDHKRLDRILATLSASGFKLITQKQGIFFMKRT